MKVLALNSQIRLTTLLAGLWMALAPLELARAGWWPWDPNWMKKTDVAYGKTAAEKADLYLVPGGNRPALIYIHGGGWAGGDKSSVSWYAERFASENISVININYRLVKKEDPKTVWPAQLQDVQLAVRWAKANAQRLGIDPNRICAMGDSAGGHLALFLGSLKSSVQGDRSKNYADQSPKVACVVDLFGPTDLTDPRMLKIFGSRMDLFAGKSIEEAPELYASASPILAVNGQTSPTLVVHGLTDKIVPIYQATALVDTLRKNRAFVQYLPFNGGHWFMGLEPSSKKNEIDDAMVDFVKAILRP